MRNIKKLAIALLVIIILGFIGYKLFHKNKSAEFNQSNDQQNNTTQENQTSTTNTSKESNTKTFSSLTAGYQIKYPESWTAEGGSATGLSNLDTFKKDSKNIVSALSYAKGYIEKDPKALLNELDMEIDGEYATRQIITDNDGIQKNRIRVQHNGKTYVLTLEDPDYLEQFNSMLATFKFSK
jgi:hypothetical protein